MARQRDSGIGGWWGGEVREWGGGGMVGWWGDGVVGR